MTCLGMALLMGACDLVGLGHDVALARLDPTDLSAPIVVPDTVKAGVPFGVLVTTISSACSGVGRTIVDQGVHSAVVVLFDEVKHGDCVSAGVYRERSFELIFESPGTADATIVGRRGDDEVTTASFEIVVIG